MATLEVHGVYEISAPAPCYLVEITLHGSTKELNLANVVFHVHIGGRKTKQVPFEEHFLSLDGLQVLGNFQYGWDHPDVWIGEVRLAFLMHYLTGGQSLKTPYGAVVLPEITERPERLKTIKYRSPY
jgi:hypothetical protein